MNKTLATVSIGFLAVAMGCGESVPRVYGKHGTIIPDQEPPMRVALEDGPSETTNASDQEQDSGYCLEWVTEIDFWDESTGEFEYLYTCAEGGNVASSHVVGQTDMLGNGHYTDTYTYRDGSVVVWTWDYHPNADGTATVYDGVATNDDTARVEQTYFADGSVQTDEVWTYVGWGDYMVDGIYEATPDIFGRTRFNGTYTFEDPNTEVSPDYIVYETHDVDGTITQEVESTDAEWQTVYTYVINPDGSSSYAFVTDDLATEVSPDYVGEYLYGADGESSGGYDQLFDDDSLLSVSYLFNYYEPEYTVTWLFDDSATEQAIDQEGYLEYDADGRGVGTLVTYVVGGDPETCVLIVEPDGTTSIESCY